MFADFKRSLSLTTAFASILAAGSAGADPFLKVDFNAGTTGGVTQEGWSVFNWSTTNVAGPKTNEYATADSGAAGDAVGVVVAAGSGIAGTDTICARDRDSSQQAGSDFPLANLYRDWINPNNNVPLWVELYGLKPGTRYDVTFYAYDNNNTSAVTGTQMLGTETADSATASYTKATEFSAATDPGLCAATLSAVSDADGTFRLKFTGSAKPPVLSGFAVAKSADQDFDLKLDFGGSSTAAAQADWLMFYASESADPRVKTYPNQLTSGSTGTVSVTVAFDGTPDSGKKIIVRDRAGNGFNVYADVFPWYNLYRDVMIAQASAMRIDIEGLLPRSRYVLTLCPYDWSYGRTYTVADVTSGAVGRSATFSAGKNAEFAADTLLGTLAATIVVLSDATGCVRIRNSVASGECAVSWLSLAYQPPLGTTLFIQ